MPSSTTQYYKRLFELRILHEYYLATNKQRDYFFLSDELREKGLNNLLMNNKYDIWRDLSIVPTPETQQMISDQHMRFIKTKTGFMLGIKIKILNDKYFPFIDPVNTPLLFHFRMVNPAFRNFTNIRLRSPLPTQYYFSNSDVSGTHVYPSLSGAVEDFSGDRTYEPGELARIDPDIMEAIRRTNSSQLSDWNKSNSIGVSHEGDNILLPMKFSYLFGRDSDNKQADFKLKTINGEDIRSFHFASAQKLDRVLIDLSLADSPDSKPISRGYYILDTQADNGYRETKKIFLDNDQYLPMDLGVLEIVNQSGNAAFDLLEPDGSVKSPSPVFEIRLKSRITYWRYRSNKGLQFKTSPKTDPFLKADQGILKTKQPIAMVASPLEFIDENQPAANIFLPNPPDQSLQFDQDGFIYSDIYVSTINDLIIEDV